MPATFGRAAPIRHWLQSPCRIAHTTRCSSTHLPYILLVQKLRGAFGPHTRLYSSKFPTAHRSSLCRRHAYTRNTLILRRSLQDTSAATNIIQGRVYASRCNAHGSSLMSPRAACQSYAICYSSKTLRSRQPVICICFSVSLEVTEKYPKRQLFVLSEVEAIDGTSSRRRRN